MQLDTYNKLYQIAEAQAGYFTTAQAATVGVDRQRLARTASAWRGTKLLDASSVSGAASIAWRLSRGHRTRIFSSPGWRRAQIQ
jgi:hypothetical protein